MPYLIQKIKHANIKTVTFVLLLIGILGYTFFQTQSLVTGPVINISKPQNGATLTASLIEIVGTTENISSISINDRYIFIDESGAFKEKLLLSPGYNIITLQAEDRFGRKTEEILELVYN